MTRAQGLGGPEWWQEMAAQAEDEGHDRFSVDWYASIRDQHFVRFPDADARTRLNLNELAGDRA